MTAIAPPSTPRATSRAGGRTRTLTERTLPVLQVLSQICLAFVVIDVLRRAMDAPPEGTAFVYGLAGAAGVAWLLVGAAWLLRHRLAPGRGRAALSILVFALAIPLSLYGTLGLVYPVLMLSLALLVLDISRRAGAIGWTVMALAGPLLILATGGALFLDLLTTVVGIGALEGVGFVLGLLWRGLEEAREADRRLIQERDAALAQVEASMERLRRAVDTEKELMLADERTRAARDLHDGLGHRLTVISMSLEFADRMRERDPQAALAEVRSARGTAVEALTEMRTWVRALSPVRDADATGLAAFDAIAESFRGTGLEVTVRRDGDARRAELSEEASLLLYRTVQEGLTNALRHGRARTASIEVGLDGDQVRLVMRSDLDERACAEVPDGALERGFGLRGLAERAQQLGGDIEAERRGDHVVLAARVPAVPVMLPREAVTA